MLLAIEAHEHAASSQNGELWACQIVGVLNSFGVFLHFLDSYVSADLFKRSGREAFSISLYNGILNALKSGMDALPKKLLPLILFGIAVTSLFPSSPPKVSP